MRISGESKAALVATTAPGMQEKTCTRRCIIGLSLFLATFALYFPALYHEFLVYDDQQYVTENPHVRAGLTWHGLVWAFGTKAGNWHPLTWLSHMLDYSVYHLHPWGHHLTSVLLHAASSALLFMVLSRVTGTMWRSAAVAALFAWHPLHVESVAWISERKDVLSAFFFMLTLAAYERYVVSSQWSVVSSRARTGWYFATLVFFALGLMSKAMVVTLPFVLLLLDVWPFGRVSDVGGGVSGVRCQVSGGSHRPMEADKPDTQNPASSIHHPTSTIQHPPSITNHPASSHPIWRILVEKLPFIFLTLPCIWLTLVAQQSAMVSKVGLSIGQRLEHSLLAYIHYLGTLFVPIRLAVYYPYEKQVPGWEVGLAGLVVSGISLLAVARFKVPRFKIQSSPAEKVDDKVNDKVQERDWGWLFTGWFWFLGMLVPVIGLVQVGDQAWADRYSYLPSIGFFIAVVWGLSEFKVQGSRFKVQSSTILLRRSLTVAALFVGLSLLVTTSIQLSYWKNTRTLFEHAAKVTKNNPLAATLLGSLLDKEGKFDEAIAKYHEALGYSPKFPEAHVCLGHALDQQGKLDEAIAEYKKALWYKPSQEETLIFLGAALAKKGLPDDAVAQYTAALKVDPESAVAHNGLAKLLYAKGQLDEAMLHYQEAINWDPEFSQAHNNLGILLLQKGRLAEGTAQLREALRLKPNNPETQLNLAQALTQQEQWSEAAALLSKIVSSETPDPNVHYQFGKALDHLHKTREAMGQYASALLLRQDFPDALDALSWILAASPDPAWRNGAEALKMSQRACELTGNKDPLKLRTLAAAYAETGRFTEAEATARKALDLETSAANKEMLERMVEQFKASKAWRTGG
ncbi:MAG: hypothetical protein C5B50_15875 [Verrucomicrobia bacterium]|nr:MAG: hypothetical protein C5B50_15875 [Verrucomicrobiota bacterium]